MGNEIEELNKKFSDLSGKFSNMQKDFELQLASAQKDAKEWKEQAQKREEEIRQHKEMAEKATREKDAAFAKARETEIASFVEAQVKAGRILPAKREAVVAFMKSLTSDAQIIEFTEKDGSKRSHTQLSLFKDLIAGMKVAVPLHSEYSVVGNQETEVPAEIDDSVQQFQEIIEEGTRRLYPVTGLDIDQKAKDYQEEMQKRGISVSYYDAVIAVSPKNRSKAVAPAQA